MPMSDATPEYLRQRAEALRSLCQQSRRPEFSAQLIRAARDLEARAQEIETRSGRLGSRIGDD
jgi:hypothetical protein